MVYGIGGKSRHAGVKAEVTAKIPVRPRRKKVPVRQAVPETTAEFPLKKNRLVPENPPVRLHRFCL